MSGSGSESVLHDLERTIADRAARAADAAKSGADAPPSWTATLLAKGAAKCAEKFGEEAVEAVIAAARGDREELVRESADVLYHLLVMLAAGDVTLDEVLEELRRRQGRGGLEEKASRSR